MANMTEGEGASARKRKTVSRRGFLDGAGNANGVTIEDAVACTFTVLDGARDVRTFTYEFGKNPDMDRMAAMFGYFTKCGNVLNSRLNDPDNPGSPEDGANDVEEFIASAESGTWADRSGGVGFRVDVDVLAGVIAEMAIEAGKLDPNAPDFGDRKDTLRRKLDEDKKFRNERFAVPEIRSRYNAAKGKSMLSLSDALAGI